MTTTVSIGSGVGRDYSTIQAAWDNLPSTLADDYVFELYNDSEFTGRLKTDLSAKVVGAYSVTIRPAAGHGFRDHVDAAANPLRYDATKGVGISYGGFLEFVFDIDVANVTLDGLQIKNTAIGSGVKSNKSNTIIQNCIVVSGGSNNRVVSMEANDCLVANCLIVSTSAGAGSAGLVIQRGFAAGNTIVYGGAGLSSGKGLINAWVSCTATNNVVIGFDVDYSPSSTTFSAETDYNATDLETIGTGQGAHNLTEIVPADVFESALVTLGTEDLRVKPGADLIGAGVADALIVADILGRTRNDPPTIGAWEYLAGTTPIAFSGTVPAQNATVGTPFSLDLSTYFSGTETPFAYTLQSGTLPDGLSLNASTGVISGTPTTVETKSGLVVRGTDDASDTDDTNSFSITVAAPTAVLGVRIQLHDGSTEQANLTGLTVAWFDDPNPATFTSPVYQSNSATTDSDGWLEVDLDNDTMLDIDDPGFLVVYKAGGTPEDDLVFAGRVVIEDIG